MTIAITGARGQLGSAFGRLIGDDAVPLTRQQLDISDRQAVLRTLHALNPRAVINCAAYTQVDKAETEVEACRAANVTAVENLAEACRELDVPLVHFSSDYVFGADRARATPYREEDSPGPQGEYARGKLAGEQAAAHCPKHIVVRTCGLYGLRSDPAVGGNFVDTMLRLGATRSHLRIVSDQLCTPSYIPHVARATLHLLTKQAWGLYHVVNAGEVTWCEFAAAIFARFGKTITLEPITTEQFAAAAERPRYSVLDTSKYRALGGPELPSWQVGLDHYLAELKEAGRLA